MSYCNNNPYNYPSAPAPRRTNYYDPYGCQPPPMMMPPTYYGTCPPHAPHHMHPPVYTPYSYPNGLQSTDPFSPPHYDKHLFENHHHHNEYDNHTVESQHCDSIPIHPPEYNEPQTQHQTQTQTQDNTYQTTTTNNDLIHNDNTHSHHHNHNGHIDDDLSTVCSNYTYSSCSCITNVVDDTKEEEEKKEEEPVTEDPPVQQDTFILRVPKNKKYRIRTVDNHGHIDPHVHVNAYGQVLPTHPHL